MEKVPEFQSIHELLLKALSKFGRIELLATYLEYLQSEWYNNIDDLAMAIEDSQAWSDLKLPGRLKLEIKNLLTDESLRSSSMNNNASFVSDNSLISDQSEHLHSSWVKCFSPEDKCAYYYNKITGETQWDEPVDDKIGAVTNSPVCEYNPDHITHVSNQLEAASTTTIGLFTPAKVTSTTSNNWVHNWNAVTASIISGEEKFGRNSPSLLPTSEMSTTTISGVTSSTLLEHHNLLNATSISDFSLATSQPQISITDSNLAGSCVDNSLTSSLAHNIPIDYSHIKLLIPETNNINSNNEGFDYLSLSTNASSTRSSTSTSTATSSTSHSFDDNPTAAVSQALVNKLLEMGFERSSCEDALLQANNDLTLAATILLTPRLLAQE